MRYICENTVIHVSKLNINEFHPKIFSAFIPETGLYIDAISMDEVKPLTNSNPQSI
jgi:hypothetical protein